MNSVPFFLSFVLPCAISAAVIAVMLRSGRVGAVDLPNTRSLHERPTPRSGGLGILAGLAVGVAQSGRLQFAVLLAVLAVLSWWDDRHNLPAGVRLVVHLGVAAGFAALGLMPGWGFALALVMVLGLVWLINLYNFMDGANGLAGGMTLIGFGAYALAAIDAGASSMAMLMLAASGAALGFLFFNFGSARIFMGDVGSVPLGCLAGAAGLAGVREGIWPLPFMLLVFSPFMVDATVTLARRALRGERVWQAHREHYYQRLIRSGWSHARTSLAFYAVMLAAGASALWLRGASINAWAWSLAGWAVAYAVMAVAIDRRWQRHSQAGQT